MKKNAENWLSAVEKNQTSAELSRQYTEWATDYDEHALIRGTRNPGLVSGFAARYVAPDDTILDAGVGTGLVGEFLHLLGYRNTVGIDMTQAMLDIAESKGIYSELYQMILGESLNFADNAFGAVVSAGVFVHNHAPAHAFDELIRVTRPDGYITFSINYQAYLHGGFEDKFKALENENMWRPIYAVPPYPSQPVFSPDRLAQIYIYQVC